MKKKLNFIFFISLSLCFLLVGCKTINNNETLSNKESDNVDLPNKNVDSLNADVNIDSEGDDIEFLLNADRRGDKTQIKDGRLILPQGKIVDATYSNYIVTDEKFGNDNGELAKLIKTLESLHYFETGDYNQMTELYGEELLSQGSFFGTTINFYVVNENSKIGISINPISSGQINLNISEPNEELQIYHAYSEELLSIIKETTDWKVVDLVGLQEAQSIDFQNTNDDSTFNLNSKQTEHFLNQLQYGEKVIVDWVYNDVTFQIHFDTKESVNGVIDFNHNLVAIEQDVYKLDEVKMAEIQKILKENSPEATTSEDEKKKSYSDSLTKEEIEYVENLAREYYETSFPYPLESIELAEDYHTSYRHHSEYTPGNILVFKVQTTRETGGELYRTIEFGRDNSESEWEKIGEGY